MFEIEETIVSRDVVDVYFACDIEACRGACCVEGESGAPVLPCEKDAICEAFPLVEPLLPKRSMAYIESNGLMYYDDDDDLVTQIVDGRECVFACFERDGSCRCSFEKAHTQGANDIFLKPISCHLYPIRLTKYKNFIAVNYHRWAICEAARERGKREGIRLYQFVKEPLIRAFGEEWYEKLDQEAMEYIRRQEREKNNEQ